MKHQRDGWNKPEYNTFPIKPMLVIQPSFKYKTYMDFFRILVVFFKWYNGHQRKNGVGTNANFHRWEVSRNKANMGKLHANRGCPMLLAIQSQRSRLGRKYSWAPMWPYLKGDHPNFRLRRLVQYVLCCQGVTLCFSPVYTSYDMNTKHASITYFWTFISNRKLNWFNTSYGKTLHESHSLKRLATLTLKSKQQWEIIKR